MSISRPRPPSGPPNQHPAQQPHNSPRPSQGTPSNPKGSPRPPRKPKMTPRGNADFAAQTPPSWAAKSTFPPSQQEWTRLGFRLVSAANHPRFPAYLFRASRLGFRLKNLRKNFDSKTPNPPRFPPNTRREIFPLEEFRLTRLGKTTTYFSYFPVYVCITVKYGTAWNVRYQIPPSLPEHCTRQLIHRAWLRPPSQIWKEYGVWKNMGLCESVKEHGKQ